MGVRVPRAAVAVDTSRIWGRACVKTEKQGRHRRSRELWGYTGGQGGNLDCSTLEAGKIKEGWFILLALVLLLYLSLLHFQMEDSSSLGSNV